MPTTTWTRWRQQDPQTVAAVHAFRQLIRAEQARQEFFTEGRLPDVSGRPEGAVRLLLEASIRVREGALAEAALLLDQAEDQRPRVSGVCNGQPFQDFRDLDDLTSCILEVLTVKGDYYWVPIAQVESIEFHEPVRPRDLLWRRTHLIVRDGPDGEVFLPVLYPGAAGEADDQIRLGRMTDWRGGDAVPVRGVGQRTSWWARTLVPILELKTVTFEQQEQHGRPEQALADVSQGAVDAASSTNCFDAGDQTRSAARPVGAGPAARPRARRPP